MVGPSTRVQDSFFGGGGDIVGNLGISAGGVLDTVTDFIPFVSGGKDIYQGIRDGNWWQVAGGVASIGLDIITGGTSSLVKGAIKTGIKQGGKYLVKKYADDALKYANNAISSQYSRIIKSADNAARGGGRVFWSGGSQARVAAESFAKSNGLKTLEMTWQGKALTKLTNATSYKLTAPLWNRASASFARGARGSVNVFQNANTGVRLQSVWRTTEYPILRGNNNIIFHNVFK